MRPSLALAFLALACSEPPPSRSAPFPPGPTARLTFPAAPRRALDLLFVIDNSGSTVEWRQALTAAFTSSFVGALAATIMITPSRQAIAPAITKAATDSHDKTSELRFFKALTRLSCVSPATV